MKKFGALVFVAATTFTIGNANAIVLGLDSFDDTANETSGPVVDVLANDLFTTRGVSCTGATCSVDVNAAVPGALVYGVTDPAVAQYSVLYTFASAVDLTAGKGTPGAADVLQIQVEENDFPFQLTLSVNNGAFESFGNDSSFFNNPPGTLDNFFLSDLTSSLTSVSSLEFRLAPLNPFTGQPATQANGVLRLAQFDLEEAPTVPVPSAILMMIAGLLGMRKIRQSA